jgi:hypothetical protein
VARGADLVADQSNLLNGCPGDRILGHLRGRICGECLSKRLELFGAENAVTHAGPSMTVVHLMRLQCIRRGPVSPEPRRDVWRGAALPWRAGWGRNCVMGGGGYPVRPMHPRSHHPRPPRRNASAVLCSARSGSPHGPHPHHGRRLRLGRAALCSARGEVSIACGGARSEIADAWRVGRSAVAGQENGPPTVQSAILLAAAGRVRGCGDNGRPVAQRCGPATHRSAPIRCGCYIRTLR